MNASATILRLARTKAPQLGKGFRLHGLTKDFGENRILKGIDLDVPAGQFLAIVGRSGCGKSTLLRILSGLDRQTGGTIEWTDGQGGPTRLMFQEPRLLPWLSVLDNVAVGLGPLKLDEGVREAARASLDEVQLAQKASEWPARLSGGQKSRVALARALVSSPGLLALDEPLGALDALTRISMQRLISRVWQQQGFTAVLVTHDVGEAVQLADRVIVLQEGRVGLDIDIPAAHPREHGSPELARIEARLLDAILTAGD